MNLSLKITLLDDVIVSASSATAAQHESLDYLAGRLLLGVAANKLYSTVDGYQAWQLFHSGEVKFGNGYIVNPAGEPGWPVPQSLHYYKSGPDWKDDQGNLITDALVRAGKDNFTNQQPKQLRKGYLSINGRYHEVDKHRSIKTAIDEDTARAEEGKLFSYEALAAGQQFVSTVQLPDGFDDELKKKLLEALVGQQRLGGSRSAQYGRVEIEQLSQSVVPPHSMARVGDTELTLWCLSELALTCPESGQPMLQPSPELFGLEKGVFCSAKSTIRHRRFSPFNGHRRSFDREQVVIGAGSVIHFERLDPLTEQQIETLTAGVGAFQEIGFGQLVVQPALLCREALQFEQASSQKANGKSVSCTEKKPTNSKLIQWLEAQQAAQPKDFTNWVASTRDALKQCFERARRIAGIDPALEIGPSPSQWGSVGQQARNLRRQPQVLIKQLFEDEKNAVCRKRAGSEHSWELIVGFDNNNEELTLAQWFKQQCNGQSPEAIARLAAEMRTIGRHRADRKQGGAA